MKYQHLLSPGSIGPLALRNRIIMTPMGTNLSREDGHCGERILSYYEARARGGAGMVIVGVASIAWPEGACNPNQVAISSDDFLPGLAALAQRVKRHGCRAAVQLQHAGKVAVRDIAAGRPMLVPSLPPHHPDEMSAALTAEELSAFVKSYTDPGARIEYRVADAADIQALVTNFAAAADRARRAGFEGVEIHAGHGYIISEFPSPNMNQRLDEYGGSLENRARLLLEVIRAVKATVGPDFPVWCRLDAIEYRVDGGINFDDAVRTAALAESAGADAIHVSAYANPASGAAFTEAPVVHRSGAYLEFAAGIKAAVSIPVIAVGRIEPELGDSVIASGDVYFSSIVYPENGRLIDYLKEQLRQLPVEVKLRTRVDGDYLARSRPDAVVAEIAAGAGRRQRDYPQRRVGQAHESLVDASGEAGMPGRWRPGGCGAGWISGRARPCGQCG